MQKKLYVTTKNEEDLLLNEMDTLLIKDDLTESCKTKLAEHGQIEFNSNCFVDVANVKDVLYDTVKNELEEIVQVIDVSTMEEIEKNIQSLTDGTERIKQFRNAIKTIELGM